MCNKIEELEKKIADLERTNEMLRYNVDDWKSREEFARNLYLRGADERARLEKANDDLAAACSRHCEAIKKLKQENEDLEKQLANALDLYDERGEVIEKHEDLKAAIKTILNSIYGVDTDGDKIGGIE